MENLPEELLKGPEPLVPFFIFMLRIYQFNIL